MTGFTIRDAVWPQDRAAACGFIHDLQVYEAAVEPDRRIDAAVGPEYFEVLMGEVAKNGGIVRIAEIDGRSIGWVAAWPETAPLFVKEDERLGLYISELFVAESARGTGAGRALIAACEDWARAHGIRVVRIGVLTANTRAAAIYAQSGFGPYGSQLRKHLG